MQLAITPPTSLTADLEEKLHIAKKELAELEMKRVKAPTSSMPAISARIAYLKREIEGLTMYMGSLNNNVLTA